MEKSEFAFINIILATLDELEASITEYCDTRPCNDCDFKGDQHLCRYKTNLLMLLVGYQMGCCEPAYRKIIDDYIKVKYPTFKLPEPC